MLTLRACTRYVLHFSQVPPVFISTVLNVYSIYGDVVSTYFSVLETEKISQAVAGAGAGAGWCEFLYSKRTDVHVETCERVDIADTCVVYSPSTNRHLYDDSARNLLF